MGKEKRSFVTPLASLLHFAMPSKDHSLFLVSIPDPVRLLHLLHIKEWVLDTSLQQSSSPS
jgi:hypothetical protein